MKKKSATRRRTDRWTPDELVARNLRGRRVYREAASRDCVPGLAARVRLARTERGLTLRQLATKMRMKSHHKLVDIEGETGRSGLTVNLFLRLADALSVHPLWLVGRTEQRVPPARE